MEAFQSATYIKLLKHARRVVRRSDEAEDLLQTVLLAAVEAGRADMSLENNRRWLIGALRKRAAFDARSALRRRLREQDTTLPDHLEAEDAVPITKFAQSLPPRLRTTALLALTGHTKREILWLMDVTDATLRQRFVEIRKRWRKSGVGSLPDLPALEGKFAFGQIRRALMKFAKSDDVVLASHDPDGNLFIVTSQNAGRRQLIDTNIH